MDVVDVISLIGQMIVGFLAGVGAATYLIFRKWSGQMRERLNDNEFDIDLMYSLHGMEPPSLMRIKLREEMDSRETKHD